MVEMLVTISYSPIAVIRYHDQPTYGRRELCGFMAQEPITITVEKHSGQSWHLNSKLSAHIINFKQKAERAN